MLRCSKTWPRACSIMRSIAHVSWPISRPRGHHFIGAFADGVMIGQLAAMVHRHPDLRPAELYVDELGVAPRFQRQGIARRLVDAAFASGPRARLPRDLGRHGAGQPAGASASTRLARLRGPSRAVMYVYRALGRRPGEQQQIAVGIAHDEGAGAPRLLLQRRKKSTPAAWNSANRARISAALPTVIEAASSSSRSRMSSTKTGRQIRRRFSSAWLAADLAVEGRLAVGEDDLEAELVGIERARRLEVGDEQLGLGGVQRRVSRWSGL